MSTPVTWNGTGYIVPAVGDASWGTNVSNYLIALPTGALQKTGGAFTLSSADVLFGASFGLQAIYYKSNSANIGASGVLRLANTDLVVWRNAANSGDLALSVTGANVLQFNSIALADVSSAQTLTNKTLSTGTVISAGKITTAVSEVDPADNTKQWSASLSGATTNTATTFTFAQTTNRTVTWPDVSDTVTMNTATQTLTGKTISGSSNTITNVSLTAGVTGTLPVLNGGTGVTTATGSGNNVLSTSPTLVTPVLGTPTSGTMTNVTGLPLTSGVTGTLPVLNGGTGQTTANTALNALLPTQATNSGKVLTTDGTNTSWAAGLTTTLTSAQLFVGNVSNAQPGFG